MKRYKDIQEVGVQEVVCWWRTLSLVFSDVKLSFFKLKAPSLVLPVQRSYVHEERPDQRTLSYPHTHTHTHRHSNKFVFHAAIYKS